jgi:DNA-binding FadR family transcriptional regulator
LRCSIVKACSRQSSFLPADLKDFMKPPSPSIRIPAKIARDLGIKIVSGRFKVGAVLDGEIEASGQRQVSRSAYREAVRILVAKGLVESRPRIGTRVSPQHKWHLLDPDILSWIFSREPQEALVSSLFELRKLIEPEVARLAALRRSPQQLGDLKEAIDEMERSTLHTSKGREADQNFHTVLLAASGNAFLAAMSSSVAAAVAWTTVFKQRTQRLRRDPVPDHRRVYEAVAASNPALAYTAMSDLLELALSDTTMSPTRKR